MIGPSCHTTTTSVRGSKRPLAIGRAGGFTLVELLVVIAVITVLTALLLPALSSARRLGRRIACQGNLKQIAVAWFAYLDDYEGKAFQNANADVNSVGWKGYLLSERPRPLNRYLSLPPIPELESQATVARCPADTGYEETYGYPIYTTHGNSYRTNIWLIGPDQTNTMSRSKELTRTLNQKYLRNLDVHSTDHPSKLLFVGDHHWVDQWWDAVSDDPEEARQEITKKEWHGVPQCFNVSFLDGHVAFLRIPQGQYHTDAYTAIPFEELYYLGH